MARVRRTGDHQPMRMARPGWAEQDPEDCAGDAGAIRSALKNRG